MVREEGTFLPDDVDVDVLVEFAAQIDARLRVYAFALDRHRRDPIDLIVGDRFDRADGFPDWDNTLSSGQPLRMIRLNSILNDPVTVVGRTFAIVIQLLIVASLLGFSIETLPHLTAESRVWLRWLEVITVVIFSAEYLLRLWAAENRWKFATSFFGIVDLLAVLPFYIAPGADLRSVRVFLLLRLFRLLKLVRYSKAVRRFHVALNIAREELILFGTVSFIMLYLSAVGIYFFENEAQPTHFASVFHSLWWATTTLTTVGYGDVYPITLGGRCFTFVVLLIGLGIISIPAGIVASALAKAREIEDK